MACGPIYLSVSDGTPAPINPAGVAGIPEGSPPPRHFKERPGFAASAVPFFTTNEA